MVDNITKPQQNERLLWQIYPKAQKSRTHLIVTNDDLVSNLERQDKWNERDIKVNIRTFPLFNISLFIF
jgi:hypothetical protein